MPAIASKEFKVGDIISDCKTMFVMIEKEFKSEYCDNCLKKSQYLKKCGKCLQMYYCEENCQTIDWKYHKNECEVYQKHSMMFSPVIERVLIRLLLCIKSNPKFVTKRHKLIDGSKVSLKEIAVDVKLMEKLIRTDFAERIGFQLICHNLKKYGMRVDRKELIHWYGLVGMMFCHPIKRFDQNPSLIFRSVMVAIAYGFYPQISNIRHSCLPTSAFVFYGSSLQLKALKPMVSGDEITLTHVILDQNKRDRQNDLPKKLVRHCNCEKCRLNLGEHLDYDKIRICLDYHLSKGMSIEDMSRFEKMKYKYDSDLFSYLRQTYGEYSPYANELRVMSFICYAMHSCHVNPIQLILWFDSLKKSLSVTHGEKHPLYQLLTKVYFDSI